MTNRQYIIVILQLYQIAAVDEIHLPKLHQVNIGDALFIFLFNLT